MAQPCLRQLMGAMAFVPILAPATGSATAAPFFSIDGTLAPDGIIIRTDDDGSRLVGQVGALLPSSSRRKS